MTEISLADSWFGIAELFLSFCYFFCGMLGFGNFLRRALVKSASWLEAIGDSFLMASLFLVGFAFLLSSLRLLSAFPLWIWWLLPVVGFWGLRGMASPLSGIWKKRWPFWALFGFIFLLRCLTASLPLEHGDPLLYHLLGPRIWAKAGGFVMDLQLPNALLASTWECLYLWPQMLWLSVKPLYGLVEAQIFSQWLHLILGWGGCAWMILRLFRGTVAEKYLPMLALGGIFVSGIQWTAPLAKNDVGIAFWVLGSLAYFREGWRRDQRGKIVLSGIFAGLAIAGKVTALLTIGPVFAVLVFAFRPWNELSRAFKFGVYWTMGIMAGAVPLYLRNYLLSGNPFYPLFAEIFPSKYMSHSWRAHFSQVAPSSPIHSFARIATRLPDLLHESPWIVGALALLLFFFLRRKFPRGVASRDSLALLAGACLAYLLFVTTQGTEIELRYLGASLMLLGAGGVWCLLAVGSRLPSSKWQGIWFFFLLAGLLGSSKLPLHVLRKIWKGPLGVAYVRRHTAGEAKEWLRMHAENGLVVVAGENETYYLSPLNVTALTEQPELDAATWNEKSLPRFVESLCRLGRARYLLDTRPATGIEARFGREALASETVFTAQGAQIYDLRLLEAKYLPGARPNCL